jgi:hypothetical protein
LSIEKQSIGRVAVLFLELRCNAVDIAQHRVILGLSGYTSILIIIILRRYGTGRGPKSGFYVASGARNACSVVVRKSVSPKM